MAGDGFLDTNSLPRMLDALDRELGRERAKATVYIAGGARMILGIREDRKTSDIDGVIREGHGAVVKATQRIARREGIPESWLNEQMTQSIPRKPDTGEVTLYSGRHLLVRGASLKHMLAMKIYAHRRVDIEDAKEIIKKLKIDNTAEVRKITEDVYSDQLPEVQKKLDSGLGALADACPDLERNHNKPTLLPPTVEARGNLVPSASPKIVERPSAKHRQRSEDGPARGRTEGAQNEYNSHRS